MAVSTLIYNTLIRRNSVFVGTILLGAFTFEIGFDSTIDRFWDRLNAGKQWKDIKHNYITSDE
ncbi:cytochrome b-c1 complex subunit 9 [Lipomyces kononenkoae]|uniref:Cytochrome b-c1 complex subunit 9 n=1 Tax=Lipomyces kononenkoae TaxID=34357 RepID=A0ACC3SYS0_LIPKO